jgi:hypothetical protein
MFRGRKCIIFFKYFLKFFFNLLFGWSYLSLTVTEDCMQKKNLIKYIDLLKDLIETYFTIIEIGISISLEIIPGIIFPSNRLPVSYYLNIIQGSKLAVDQLPMATKMSPGRLENVER